MPRYEYVCRDCGHNFETQQRIVDDPLLNCPSCKQDGLERIVSRTSFALKGGGWYADGYGGGSSGNGASGSNGSSTKSTSKPETTSSTSTASESASSETQSSATESKPKSSGAE